MFTYSEYPYLNLPIEASHPNHLKQVVKNLDIDLNVKTVLEIGCGTGANARHIATTMPDVQVFAFDNDPGQIEIARKDAPPNVKFEVYDLRKPYQGRFDVIIAHGIFSWVNPALQSALFKAIRRGLTEDGLAFVSYNVFPGWGTKLLIREIMQRHITVQDPGTDRIQQARAILAFLADHNKDQDTWWARMLLDEHKALSQQPDWYLAHDHLEKHNHPVWFCDFVKQANEHGLRYIVDAQPHSLMPYEYPESAKETLLKLFDKDPIRFEQYVDFLRNRAFRQSILMRDK